MLSQIQVMSVVLVATLPAVNEGSSPMNFRHVMESEEMWRSRKTPGQCDAAGILLSVGWPMILALPVTSPEGKHERDDESDGKE
jgi:hypothetical protein